MIGKWIFFSLYIKLSSEPQLELLTNFREGDCFFSFSKETDSLTLININGAETNCGIAHILGILLMNSCNTVIFLATTMICSLSTLYLY